MDVYTCKCLWVCTSSCKPQHALSYHSSGAIHLVFIYFKTGLLSVQELSKEARLAGKKTPGIFLSESPVQSL